MFTWLNMDISFNVHVAKHPLQEGEGVHGNLNSLLCMKQKISWNTARFHGTRWKGGTRSVRARKRRDRPIDRWMDNIQRRTCIVKFGYHGINKCDRLTPGVFFTFFSLNIFPHIIQEDRLRKVLLKIFSHSLVSNLLQESFGQQPPTSTPSCVYLPTYIPRVLHGPTTHPTYPATQSIPFASAELLLSDKGMGKILASNHLDLNEIAQKPVRGTTIEPHVGQQWSVMNEKHCLKMPGRSF